jgi:hypothetical protein
MNKVICPLCGHYIEPAKEAHVHRKVGGHRWAVHSDCWQESGGFEELKTAVADAALQESVVMEEKKFCPFTMTRPDEPWPCCENMCMAWEPEETLIRKEYDPQLTQTVDQTLHYDGYCKLIEKREVE